MLDDAIHINERAHVVFGKHFDFVDFMRGAEAVEKMQERDPRFERSGVRDQCHVHGFLHGVGGEHGKSGARQDMTSEWSPKIESAWVAKVRADTWNAVGVSSPAILFMFGIIRSRP